MTSHRKPKTTNREMLRGSEVTKYFGDVTLEQHLAEHTHHISKMTFSPHHQADLDVCGFTVETFVSMGPTTAEIDLAHDINRAIDAEKRFHDAIRTHLETARKEDALAKTLKQDSGFIRSEFERLQDRLAEIDAEERAEYMMGHEERDYDPFHDDSDQDPNVYRGEL